MSEKKRVYGRQGAAVTVDAPAASRWCDHQWSQLTARKCICVRCYLGIEYTDQGWVWIEGSSGEVRGHSSEEGARSAAGLPVWGERNRWSRAELVGHVIALVGGAALLSALLGWCLNG